MVSRCSESNLTIIRPGARTEELAGKFGCSYFQAALLEMRGVTLDSFPSVVDWWLKPDMESLLSTLKLGETNGDAAEIFKNLNKDSSVVVYGDYDVDGVSATSIAISLALYKRAHVRYFIPHRYKQGYGVHMNIAQNIAKLKCDLVIIVDCGTQSIDEIKAIRASGARVVVLDHHLAENGVACPDTMVNPQLQGSAYAKKLCAAGVIWCWAWQNELIPKEKLYELLDLVALATIADCVSLASPLNRILVRTGIEQMQQNARPGLAMLMEKMMINPKTLCAEDLSMKVIPCLNAAGRLYLADLAVEIFFPAADIANKVDRLIELNMQRREISGQILEQVINDEGEYKYVLIDNNWSAGVLSSVASRVCSDKKMPIALVAEVGDTLRGTLRMPAGGDAVAVLSKMKDKLSNWGGHKLAAGFSVSHDMWPNVRDELEEMLSSITVTEEKESYIYWEPQMLDMDKWQQAMELGPFGMDNPTPAFYAPYKGTVELEPLGKNGRHFKINVGDMSMLAFNSVSALIKNRAPISGWIYKPRLDTWRNVTSLQFVLDKVVEP